MNIVVKVKTGKGKQEVIETTKDKYVVSLKSRPEDYKANIELIKLMKKELGKSVKMISGFQSKEKVLEVSDGN